MKANHRKHSFAFNGQDIDILPGQFITGRSKATKELPITPQSWRTAMGYLKSTSRITIETNNKFTLVTVKKWHEYQDEVTSKLTNQQPTSNQPVTTYNNDKNDKNDITVPGGTSLTVGNEVYQLTDLEV